jgi:hypothetical protein
LGLAENFATKLTSKGINIFHDAINKDIDTSQIDKSEYFRKKLEDKDFEKRWFITKPKYCNKRFPCEQAINQRGINGLKCSDCIFKNKKEEGKMVEKELEMIDLYMESRRGIIGSNAQILYRVQETKGLKSILITISTEITSKLGWSHKDKIKVLTDYSNFVLQKTERFGYSINLSDKKRGVIKFAIKNQPFSRENQDIKDYQIDGDVLKFSVKPLEIIIPEDN